MQQRRICFFAGKTEARTWVQQRLGFVTHSLIDPMFQIDLPLAAELLVVLLIVATMDGSSPWDPAAEPSVNEPEQEEGWSVEADLHAQRILRLERRQAETSATRA